MHKPYYEGIEHAVHRLLPNMLQDVLGHLIPQRMIHGKARANYQLKQRLKPSQLRKINGAMSNGYKNFDVFLIYLVVRNLCPNITPTRGWDHHVDPLPYETTLGDDIKRCLRKQNDILSRGDNVVSHEEFNNYFNDFKDIANRLEIFLNKKPGEYVSQFDALKISSMEKGEG